MKTTAQWIELLDKKLKEFEPNCVVEKSYWNVDIKENSTLVVCIGESWTWGDGGLTDRPNQMYGRLLSNHYNADWINIGGRGYSNTWMLDFANFVASELKSSNYQKIIFVVTMTENGRDCSTRAHHNYDYFKYDPVTEETFDLILSDFEDIYINKLTTLLENINDRYKLVVGNGFSWNQKTVDWLTSKNIIQPNLTWVELLADKQNIPRPERTNLVYNFTFSMHLARLLETNPKYNSIEYKSWVIPKMDLAEKTHEFLQKSKLNFDIHPNAEGHNYWAQEIIKLLEMK